MVSGDALRSEIAQVRAELDQLKLRQVELEQRIQVLEQGLATEPGLASTSAHSARAVASVPPAAKPVESLTNDPMALVNSHSSSAEKISLFRSRFSGRSNVYTYAWEWPEKQKKGWSPKLIDKVAGEGFDLPTLDTLVLAAPARFKGNIIQQVGRITRDASISETKQRCATVHDFNDHLVPVLNNMFRKRRAVILKEGFTS